jgi:hypothetical protein
MLEVRDVGPIVFSLRAGEVPIKVNGFEILEDDQARKLLRELIATGLYERVKE